MSGLLALLDDVAVIAKTAAASVDDVIGQAAKAGAKAAGAAIDDAAVTPGYVAGFSADRELPVVWKIARGSIFNKMAILLPLALALSAFAPWAIPPLLMLGGAYLCFEGAEKAWHWLRPPAARHRPPDERIEDAAHLEERKVRGAIKTDFILSAEIMTIALSALETESIWFEAAALAVVAVAITVLVYGAVAAIVKADDVGLHWAAAGRTGAVRALGRAVVRGMPGFMRALLAVGTAAMLWVGGQIVVHGVAQMGRHGPEDAVAALAQAFAPWGGPAEWLAGAALHGGLGLMLGLALMPMMHHLIAPTLRALGVSPDST